MPTPAHAATQATGASVTTALAPVRRRRARWGWLDLVLLLGLSGLLAYLAWQTHSVFAYRWDWSTIWPYVFRYDAASGQWVSNLLVVLCSERPAMPIVAQDGGKQLPHLLAPAFQHLDEGVLGIAKNAGDALHRVVAAGLDQDGVGHRPLHPGGGAAGIQAANEHLRLNPSN